MLRATYGAEIVRFPTSWDEVTLRQFKVLESPGEQNILVALADRPDVLLRLPDPDLENQVLPFLTFLDSVPEFDQLPVPDTVTVTVEGSTRVLTKPPGVGLQTYGQKLTADEELRRLIAQDKYNFIDAAYPLLLIYYYPQLSGKDFVDIAETKPYEGTILDLPCTVALPLGAFFLSQYNRLTTSGTVTYEMESRVILPRWKRLGQWFLSWHYTRRMRKPTV